jgi:hypothetical protein
MEKGEGDDVVLAHACDKKAVVTYSKLNPERRKPDEPRQKIHPRCTSHDTPAARKAAPEQGYERTEL